MHDTAGVYPGEVLISRMFGTPGQRLFSAWTDPKQLAQWWGPAHFTNPVCLVNLVPGGGLYIVMQAPDGTDYPVNGTYLEIVVPELLVFTSGMFEDRFGNDRLELQHTVIFDAGAAYTKLTVHTVVMRSAPETQYILERIEGSWMQSLERLARMLGHN